MTPNDTPTPTVEPVTAAQITFLREWCEDQIKGQQALAAEARRVIVTYGHGTIGPDPDEAAFRGQNANNFWQMARLLDRIAADAEKIAALEAIANELQDTCDKQALRLAVYDALALRAAAWKVSDGDEVSLRAEMALIFLDLAALVPEEAR